jgi:hypothetical protein
MQKAAKRSPFALRISWLFDRFLEIQAVPQKNPGVSMQGLFR